MIKTLSPHQLIDEVKTLNLPDLEWFTQQVIAIRAQRKGLGLPRAESDLLLQINQGMSPDLQARYYTLIKQQELGDLTLEQHKELFELAKLNEQIAVKRTALIAQLADLRRKPISTVLHDLGLEKPLYV